MFYYILSRLSSIKITDIRKELNLSREMEPARKGDGVSIREASVLNPVLKYYI